jgi:hypothetical protein
MKRQSSHCLFFFGTFLFVLAIAAGCSKSPSTSSPGSASNASSSSGSSSAHAIPSGFQSFDNPGGSGHLLYAKLSVTDPSASNSMRSFLGTLNSFFDAPPQLLAAVGNPTDQVVQATLSGNIGGKPVTGIATVTVAGQSAIVGLVYDAPAALKTSFKPLYQKLSQQMPQGSSTPFTLATPQNWQRQTGGDRSAALNLPDGWKVDAITKGIVAVSGPHKEYVELGYTFFINTVRLPGSVGMVSPYLEPVAAFAFSVRANSTVTGFDGITVHQTIGRLIASKSVPAPMQGGKGAYLLQELTVNNVLYKVYALVYTAPLPMAGWTLYTSYVAAPASVFDSEFGDMMRMWASWKVDDRVYQEQIQQTLQSMAETRAILSDTSSAQRQMQDADNMFIATDNLINGETSMMNSTTGTSQNVYSQNSANYLQACKNQGMECKAVPFNQLTGH